MEHRFGLWHIGPEEVNLILISEWDAPYMLKIQNIFTFNSLIAFSLSLLIYVKVGCALKRFSLSHLIDSRVGCILVQIWLFLQISLCLSHVIWVLNLQPKLINRSWFPRQNGPASKDVQFSLSLSIDFFEGCTLTYYLNQSWIQRGKQNGPDSLSMKDLP